MPEDAVMDAAVDTALDTAVETPELEQPDTPTEGATETPEGQTPAIEAPAKPLIDGGKLSAEAKETLDKIKAENPALARAIQRALFKEAEVAKALPGGLKEVQALRDTVEKLGGEVGIQELQQEVAGFRGFDEQYTAGDPKAIEFMTSDDAGKEAFLKLMPHALQKFEALHPDGFSNYMAQVINGTMESYRVPLALALLERSIKDNPEAQEQYAVLARFYNSIGQLASKQVQAPKFQSAQPDQERSKFEQERTQFERDKWKNETATQQRPAFEAEWNRLTAGRKLTTAQTSAIQELFESRFNKSINGQHAQTLQRYFDAKDKAGFMKYAAKLDSEVLPQALRAAFDAVMPAKPGPRNGAPPPPINGKQPAKGLPIAQGFVQVAQQPKTHEIDYRNPFNTKDNFRDGKAILIGGRKVQWTKQA